MTVREFYFAVEGDYQEVTSRLMNDDIIKRFLLKFPNDESFSTLEAAIESDDAEKAFMAAHTLKGVTISLGLGKLNMAAAEVTELLRGASVANTQEVNTAFATVKESYNEVLALINDVN